MFLYVLFIGRGKSLPYKSVILNEVKDLIIGTLRFFADAQNDNSLLSYRFHAGRGKSLPYKSVILNEVKDLIIGTLRFFADAQNDNSLLLYRFHVGRGKPCPTRDGYKKCHPERSEGS